LGGGVPFWDRSFNFVGDLLKVERARRRISMQKFLMAALAATGLALAAISGAVAAPVAPIGKAADAIDASLNSSLLWLLLSSPSSSLLVALRPQDLPLVMGPRPGVPERMCSGALSFLRSPLSQFGQNLKG
jgi:hypothetical protein